MVVESQAAGTLTPEFVAALRKIVDGIRGRYGMADPDDVFQDVCLSVIKNLGKLNPKKNLFSYLTTCVRNEAFKRHRERDKADRLAQRVYQRRRDW